MKRKLIIWGSVLAVAAIGGYLYFRAVKKKTAKEFNPEEKEGKTMDAVMNESKEQ